jgi:hypothetical protein
LTPEKWIGIHTGGAHYLDHLGIVCEGLDIPLIVTEPSTYLAAQTFYPKLRVLHHDLSELTLDFLAHSADVIFESGHHFAIDLLPILELTHGKKMRVVYCPHGNSDKKTHTRKDISLIYGDHMHSHLLKTEEMSRLEKTVITGNYRQAYYKTHQRWYDNLLENVLQGKLRADCKTVFYAPTWPDTSLKKKKSCDGLRVIEEVGSCFNLLIRWHPFLEDLDPAHVEKMKKRCHDMKGIIDLSAFPSIYPILNRTDFYLGDFSSIGYDFLSFNKPLFFLKHGEGEINDCAVTLTGKDHWGRAIEQFQDHANLSEKRKKLSTRVFGVERTFQTIKADLQAALSQDRNPWIPHLPL